MESIIWIWISGKIKKLFKKKKSMKNEANMPGNKGKINLVQGKGTINVTK